MLHDVMSCDQIQGQGHETLKVEDSSNFEVYAIYNRTWQMTTES